METNHLVLIEHFCSNHQIDLSFIDSLHEFGLIEVIIAENNKYLPHDQLSQVERMIRFHYELNINMEGIDVITNLLKQIHYLQDELAAAKNRLQLYGDD